MAKPTTTPTAPIFTPAQLAALAAAGFTAGPPTSYLGNHHHTATRTTATATGNTVVSVVAMAPVAGGPPRYRAATLYHAPAPGGTATTPGPMGPWGAAFAPALAAAVAMC